MKTLFGLMILMLGNLFYSSLGYSGLPIGSASKQLTYWLKQAEMSSRITQVHLPPGGLQRLETRMLHPSAGAGRHVSRYQRLKFTLRKILTDFAATKGVILNQDLLKALPESLLLSSVDYVESLQRPTLDSPSYLFGSTYLPLVLDILRRNSLSTKEETMLQHLYRFNAGKLHPALLRLYATPGDQAAESNLQLLEGFLKQLIQNFHLIGPMALYRGDGKTTTFADNDRWGKEEGLQLIWELLKGKTEDTWRNNIGVKEILRYHGWEDSNYTLDLMLQLRYLGWPLGSKRASMEDLVEQCSALLAQLGIVFKFDIHFRLIRTQLLASENAFDPYHAPLASFLGLEYLADSIRFPHVRGPMGQRWEISGLNQSNAWEHIFQLWRSRAQYIFQSLDFRRPGHRQIFQNISADVSPLVGKILLGPLLIKAAGQLAQDSNGASAIFRQLNNLLSELDVQ